MVTSKLYGKLFNVFENEKFKKEDEQRWSLQVMSIPKDGEVSKLELIDIKLPKNTNPNPFMKEINSEVEIFVQPSPYVKNGKGELAWWIKDVKDINFLTTNDKQELQPLKKVGS